MVMEPQKSPEKLRKTFVLLRRRSFPRDPSTQIIPTLGPEVCKYYLHWAIWIPRVWVSMLFLGQRSRYSAWGDVEVAPLSFI